MEQARDTVRWLPDKKISRLSPVLVLTLLVVCTAATAEVNVSTLVKLNASGGLTFGPDGYLYASDFGPRLGPAEESTPVYRVDPESGSYTVFAAGFAGASGAAFDASGRFYQAEPRGNRVTRINLDGSRDIVAEGLNTPVGVQVDKAGNLYVCNCGTGEILGFDTKGNRRVLAGSAARLACPNGLTQDDAGNLYAVTFAAGKVVKITPAGELTLLAELPTLQGGPNPVGLGHIAWHKGELFVTAIGAGQVYGLRDDGSNLRVIAGKAFAFTNVDGIADQISFSKPNGIAVSPDGSRLFVNVSEPAWPTNPAGLHPAALRVISHFRE